jgi:hypothetical protein
VKQVFRNIAIQRLGLTIQAGSAFGTFLLWYLYDTCRFYSPEVPVAIGAVSAVSLVLFRYWHRSPDA